MSADLWLSFVAALAGGAIRIGTPYLFVSLGECLTEKSGRINLGLEGVLVLSSMTAFGASYLCDSVWMGVTVAALSGAMLALLHGLLCSLKKVNDIATGIALMMLGAGLAFYGGKSFIQPQAPQLVAISLGGWSDNPAIQAALQINPLVPVGILLAILMWRGLSHTRAGLKLRMVGDSAQAARAAGYPVTRIRILATMAGGAIAGLGGASLTLFYPGSWAEGISGGQGLIAVALVIFARWQPLRCVWASLLFGAAGAAGPALQAAGISSAHHLLNTLPYVLTLLILILSCRSGQIIAGSPGELGAIR